MEAITDAGSYYTQEYSYVTVHNFSIETSTTSMSSKRPSRLTWGIIIFMVMGSIGVLDNMFTLVVILSSKTMRRKVNNKLIINQSAIDVVASVFLIANAPAFPDPVSPPGVLGKIYCHLWVSNYFLWSVLTVSVFNLIAITIERYIEIVKPLQYKELFTHRRANIAMISVWAAGFIFITLPNLGPSGVINGICYPYSLWPNNTAASIVGVITFFVFYMLPIIVMIYCYTHMILVFRSKVKPFDPNQSAAEKKRSEKMQKIQRNLMKTLMIVACAFGICWCANQVTFFLFNLGVKVDLYGTYFQVFVYISFSNCVINPFIYTFQYQEFRVAMKKLLGIKQRTDDNDESTGTEVSALPK